MRYLLFILITLFSINAHAVTYWVSNTGEETTASECDGVTPIDGTLACDLATVNAAVAAGDTVYLRGGAESYEVYSISAASGAGEGIQPDASGTVGNVITYSAYNDEMVELQRSANIQAWLVEINTLDYIKVSGSSVNYLKITGGYKNLYIGVEGSLTGNYARYNEIAYVNFSEGNTFNGAYDYAYAVNTVYRNAQYNWIHHCKFFYHGVSLGLDLFHLGSDPTWSNYRDDLTQYNVIEDCEFAYSGHAPFSMQGRYNIIRNNYVYNPGFMDSGSYLYAFRGILGMGDYDVHARDNILEGNRFGHADRSLARTWGSTGMDWAQSHTIMRYNSFFNNGSTAIEFRGILYAGARYSRSNDNMVYNNTFYYNQSNYVGESDPGVIAFQKGSSTTDYHEGELALWHVCQDNVLKNNLFYDNHDNRNSSSVYDLPSGWDTCPSSQTAGCNIITNNYNDVAGENTDPKFVDTDLTNVTSWTLPDLNLQSGSPVEDQGTYLTQANGTGSSSVTLIVDEAAYFQDGKFGSASGCDPAKWPAGVDFQADWIAIGTVSNVVQISAVNYSTNTITLTSAKTWAEDASIWLYKKSDSTIVLLGAAPEIGAFEYEASQSAALTGTAISGGVTEAEIVTGSETIIIKLTNDTWVATVGADNAITTALIAGIDSNLAEAAGWDAVVKANMVFGDITRDSSTQVTIVLAAEATYDITQTETITVTIPTTAVTSGEQTVATPTFPVSVDVPSPPGPGSTDGLTGAYNASGISGAYNSSGITVTP